MFYRQVFSDHFPDGIMPNFVDLKNLQNENLPQQRVLLQHEQISVNFYNPIQNFKTLFVLDHDEL